MGYTPRGKAVLIAAGAILLALVFVGAGYLIWLQAVRRVPAYTVAVTGVGGLDPTLDLRSDGPLFPVFNFNLTVGMKSLTRKHGMRMRECIGGSGIGVFVFYGEVLLGDAAVPELCVESRQEGERAFTAWGMYVGLPPFMRERLAGELEGGEAVLDVVLLTAATSCKVKIGGGPCRC